MINGKKILAIIPARAGSKRLPDKNIRLLSGKPLIAWSINAARQSRYIDAVIVSTDSDEIMSIARQYGADVPFRRPDELSTDAATSNAVILHCLDNVKCPEGNYDIVLLLQPTSPARQVSDIETALEYFEEKKAKGVISVCECEHNPLWSNTLPADASLDAFIDPAAANKRSQELPVHYRFNGAIYIFDTNEFIEKQGVFYSPDVFAYVMDRRSSVDIDNIDDFEYAEFLLAQNRLSTNNYPGTGND